MSLDLLYNPPKIKKGYRRTLRFLKRIDLPFLPAQVFSSPEELFFYAPGKSGAQRARLTIRNHRLEVFASEPRLVSRAAFQDGLLVAFEEKNKLILSRYNTLAQIPNESFAAASSSLAISRQGPVLFDQTKGEVWRYRINPNDPFSRKDASWQLLSQGVSTFLSTGKSALFLEESQGSDIPNLAYLNEVGGICRSASFLDSRALHAPFDGISCYLAEGKLLRLLDCAKGRDLFATSLPDKPRMISASREFLCLLYDDFLEIRKEGEPYLMKEKTRGISHIAIAKEQLFLLEKEKATLRVYSF